LADKILAMFTGIMPDKAVGFFDWFHNINVFDLFGYFLVSKHRNIMPSSKFPLSSMS
jgi:hypothetical protein